jgi:hypothetical protein
MRALRRASRASLGSSPPASVIDLGTSQGLTYAQVSDSLPKRQWVARVRYYGV